VGIDIVTEEFCSGKGRDDVVGLCKIKGEVMGWADKSVHDQYPNTQAMELVYYSS
jgi:hypothetical protein